MEDPIGWKGSAKTGMKDELCGAALHLTLFNQGVDVNHPQYKKLYDAGIIKDVYKHTSRKQDVSQGLIKAFEQSWLGRKQSLGSARDTYVEAGWLKGSELELDPISFKEVVTKYLIVGNTAGTLLPRKTAADGGTNESEPGRVGAQGLAEQATRVLPDSPASQ
ncbi:hypothetical protein SLS64_006171 [Diaporthe eres]